jgi:hypothetical protein
MQVIGKLLFALGSIDFKEEEIIAIVKLVPANTKVFIHASACPTPVFKEETKKRFGNNMMLSLARAVNVTDRLIANGLVETQIVHVLAVGAQPCTPEQYEQARSVTVRIHD